jgi:GntR family transcriptional regulator
MLKKHGSLSDDVLALLHKRIGEGTYLVGSRLPSEHQLIQEFGVSRSTVREAIKKLEARGEVFRQPGRGTYVSERSAFFTLPMQSIQDLRVLIERTGHHAEIGQHQFIQRLSNPEETKRLQQPKSILVAEINQLYLADRTPILHANYILPLSRLKKDPSSERIDSSLPFPEILNKYLVGRIYSDRTVIHSILGDPQVMDRLKISDRIPTLRVIDTFMDDEGRPIALDTVDVNDHEFDLVAFYIFS